MATTIRTTRNTAIPSSRQRRRRRPVRGRSFLRLTRLRPRARHQPRRRLRLLSGRRPGYRPARHPARHPYGHQLRRQPRRLRRQLPRLAPSPWPPSTPLPATALAPAPAPAIPPVTVPAPPSVPLPATGLAPSSTPALPPTPSPAYYNATTKGLATAGRPTWGMLAPVPHGTHFALTGAWTPRVKHPPKTSHAAWKGLGTPSWGSPSSGR